jgi:hypothetical protein
MKQSQITTLEAAQVELLSIDMVTNRGQIRSPTLGWTPRVFFASHGGQRRARIACNIRLRPRFLADAECLFDGNLAGNSTEAKKAATRSNKPSSSFSGMSIWGH